jgi:hypothetical protein
MRWYVDCDLQVCYEMHYSSSLSTRDGSDIADPAVGIGGTVESMMETSGWASIRSILSNFSLPPASPTLPIPSGVLPTFPAPILTGTISTLAFDLDPKPSPIPINLKLPNTHHPTPPTTRSRILRFIIHPTQSKKKRKAARIVSRSHQSAFSSCLIICPEASRREV